jgi:hypothetical protein
LILDCGQHELEFEFKVQLGETACFLKARETTKGLSIIYQT